MKKGLLTVVTLASLVGLVGCKSEAASKKSYKTPSISELCLEAGTVFFGLKTSYEEIEYDFDDQDESKIVGANIVYGVSSAEYDNYTDIFFSYYGTSTKEGLIQPLIDKYEMTCLETAGEYTFSGQSGTLSAWGCSFGIQLKGTEYLSMAYFIIDYTSLQAGLFGCQLEVSIIDIKPAEQ